MIKSVEQYLYVKGDNVDDAHPHGDLDRIKIDGQIMPVRSSGETPVIIDDKPVYGLDRLRGVDIAFLAEAVGERSFWPQSQRFTFSRKLDHYLISSVAYQVKGLYEDREWIVPGFEFNAVSGLSSRKTPKQLFPQAYEIDHYITQEIIKEKFVKGAKVERDPIYGLFNDIERIHSYCDSYSTGYFLDSAVTYEGSVIPPDPSPPEDPSYVFNFDYMAWRSGSSSGVDRDYCSLRKALKMRLSGYDFFSAIREVWVTVQFSSIVKDDEYAFIKVPVASLIEDGIITVPLGWLADNGFSILKSYYGYEPTRPTTEETFNHDGASIRVWDVYPVLELRDRTRWDT